MATDRTQAAETAELVDLLFTVMPMVADHTNSRLDEFGMTTTHYWALRSIDGPTPMKNLAHCMDIDPSYVTLVADGLEELGLVERQPHPTDRRIKNLVLTAKGERARATIPDKLWAGPNTFSSLTDNERAKLTALLTKIATAAQNESSEAATP